MEGRAMREPTRDELLSEYDRLCGRLVAEGLEPTVVTDAVLEVFSDGELRALIKDSVRRLLRIRALET